MSWPIVAALLRAAAPPALRILVAVALTLGLLQDALGPAAVACLRDVLHPVPFALSFKPWEPAP